VIVRPYGDTRDDGAVQLSFTLPIPWSETADEAARRLVGAMGFNDVTVVDGRPIAANFSFFVVYARTPIGVDLESVRAPAAVEATLTMDEVDALIETSVGGRRRVAGAWHGYH
jgi:beta-lysine 5,6-aminomutase beta subunit